MPEAVYFFWGVVALLVVAAGCNHGWHHARDRHLAERLTRASGRDRGAAVLAVHPPTVGVDTDWASGA